MRFSEYQLTWSAVLAAVLPLFAAAAEVAEGPRARPPEWPRDVVDVFFDDARQALAGARPDYQRAPTAVAAEQPTGEGDRQASDDRWSKLVDAETIETEIKRQLTTLQPLVENSAVFKGGGYQQCRERFSWLATLFAVAARHEQRVRWQDTADEYAQLFARAGFNCKVGTDQTFREAQLRVQDLADLVRGGRPSTPPAQADVPWNRIADRSPLMQRMEQAVASEIGPNASDSRALERNAEELQHSGQLLAVLAEVIGNPDYDYAEEESYHEHAVQLRTASVAFTQAVNTENFQAAREALGSVGQSCSNCHNEYR